MANSKWQITSRRRQKAVGRLQELARNKLMAYGEQRMANSRWRIADNKEKRAEGSKRGSASNQSRGSGL